MDKIYVFEKELNTIKNKDIKNFAEHMIEEIPEYFFEVAASSTGKYHPAYALGKGGLARHTKAAVRFLNHILQLEQYSKLFTDRERDLLRVAVLYHDAWKHGENDCGFTTFDHPVVAAQHIRNYDGDLIGIEEQNFVADAIASHMGQWNTSNRDKTVLPKPSTFAQELVHLSDYLASRKDIIVVFESSEEQEKPTVDTYKLPFGKYRGKTLKEIEEIDSGWIDWAKHNITNEPVKILLGEM